MLDAAQPGRSALAFFLCSETHCKHPEGLYSLPAGCCGVHAQGALLLLIGASWMCAWQAESRHLVSTEVSVLSRGLPDV